MATTSGIIDFDEETSRQVEALYLTPDVVEQRRTFVAALGLRGGERVLDVGSGPGLLACEIAQAVGPGGSVRGVDISDSMLALARRRADLAGAVDVQFEIADATALPFPDASFDVAVSTQVYEYVADMPAALAEVKRVLAPGGRLAILDTDWDSVVWRSPDDELTGRVRRAWDEHLVHRDLPRRLPQLLREAGFALERCDAIPLLNVGYRRETFSGLAMEFMAEYIVGRQDLTREDADRWRDGLKGLGDDYFFSVNRYLFVATR